MKGIVLAGGLGTRLYPVTKKLNKHVIKIHDRPMIHYPIETLIKSGIKDITIVLGGNYTKGVRAAVHNMKLHEKGVRYRYEYQPNPLGIAHAITYTDIHDDVAVILGDNIFEQSFEDEIDEFYNKQLDCMLFTIEHETPERFGVYDGEKIIEKPENPPTNKVVTGFYIYNPLIYNVIYSVEIEKGLSDRRELEITDVNNLYLKHYNTEISDISGFWSDAGTFKALAECTRYKKK